MPNEPKPRRTNREIYAEFKWKTTNDRFIRALKKAPKGSEWVMVKAMGVKDMNALTERGWEILSHSPSNYSHADNRYVMRRRRVDAVRDVGTPEDFLK